MIKKRSKAFTLVEVMVALLILGIGMSFLYAMFPLGIRISRDVQLLGRISFFAQKKIEGLKASNETPSNSSGEENDFNWTIKVRDYSLGNITLNRVELDAQWLQGETIRKKSFVTYLKY